MIGTAGCDANFLDIGFAENKERQHAGIDNFEGTTVLRLEKREPKEKKDNKPSFKLSVKGDISVEDNISGDISVKGSITSNGTVNAEKFVGVGAFVTGMIIMWYEKADGVPKGWALCDGQDITEGELEGQKTPDLRDKFVLGTSDMSRIGQSGGKRSHRLSKEEMPSHRHRIYAQCGDRFFGQGNMPADIDNVPEDYSSGQQVKGESKFTVSNFATTTYSGAGGGYTNSNSTNQSFDLMPPYYTLAYIMKL